MSSSSLCLLVVNLVPCLVNELELPGLQASKQLLLDLQVCLDLSYYSPFKSYTDVAQTCRSKQIIAIIQNSDGIHSLLRHRDHI